MQTRWERKRETISDFFLSLSTRTALASALARDSLIRNSYRMSLHQDLYGNDFLKRVNFCNWIRRKMRTDVSFLSHVLFSGEANFANTRNVNRHNMHYGQMRILDGWELYHFNIRGPSIVGAALSTITSLIYIFFKVAWLGKFTQNFCKTYCPN